MAKRIKNGIAALGLGILLGISTPTFAKDVKQPEIKTLQEEQGPAFTYPVVKTFLTYEANTPVNDEKTIKMGIDYVQITMLGNIPMQGMDSIILTGKKDKGSVKLEEIGFYIPELQSFYMQKGDETNPVVKNLAEKILKEKTYNQNQEPDELIYKLFEALNAQLIEA